MSAAKLTAKAKSAKAATIKVPGKPIDVDLEDLLFDEHNPRLPEEVTDRSQDSLLAYIATEYHPIEVARSISDSLRGMRFAEQLIFCSIVSG